MPVFVPAQRDLLACDLVVSADGGQWEEDQPALLLGLRGLCALQIDVRGARGDVHSGSFGGTFQNPIHALSSLIASMRSPAGKILVEGFYDAVRPLAETDRAGLAAIPYDEGKFKTDLGVSELYGEPGFSTYERMWTRPTLDVNGIWGGFQGEGVKTVISSEAHAKISCRLVADQDPARILDLLTAHIARNTPPGVSVTVTPNPSTAFPYLIPADHPGNRAVYAVHKALYGKEPFHTWMGGSIPICGILLKALGAYTANLAFGLKDEQVHAPDEFFRLSSFARGQRAYGLLLEQIGRHGLGG
jgi:acetylornithine deacetylase/succinyl-diaminopimelate desuccinylase-like protein